MNFDGLKINPADNTVIINKKFANAASKLGSPAYNVIRKLRQDGFTIINRTAIVSKTKKTHYGLTVKWIENYVRNRDEHVLALAEFDKVKKDFKGHPSYYAQIKQWFISRYPDYLEEKKAEEAMDAFVERLKKEKAQKEASNVSELPTSPTESNEPQAEEKGA